MADIFQIIEAPIMTEQSTMLAEKFNQYVFRVHRKANKNQIKQAVEKLFNTKVVSVNTLNYKGKPKTHPRSRKKGRTTTYKKAIIRLAPGETIEFV